jgi:hypothetical protein
LFIQNSIISQIIDALKVLVENPWLGLLVLVISIFILGIYRKKFSSTVEDNPKKTALMFLYGGILFGMAIFPYAVVNLAPARTGWDTRHAILISLPVAILFVSFYRLNIHLLKERYAILSLLAAIMLMFSFSFLGAGNYMSWQARWVKDRSIMYQLSHIQTAGNYSIYWVDDQFPKGGETSYRFYEWSSIFKKTWGKEIRIGADITEFQSPSLGLFRGYFTERMNLKDLDLNGPQAKLTIKPGKRAASNLMMSLHYLYYKAFDEDKLERYLARLTAVVVEPCNQLAEGECPALMPED